MSEKKVSREGIVGAIVCALLNCARFCGICGKSSATVPLEDGRLPESIHRHRGKPVEARRSLLSGWRAA